MGKLTMDGGTPVRTKPFPKWPVFGEEEERQILEVVRSGHWGGTGRIKLPEFEEKFAAFHDAKYAVTCVNGTLAITIALKAAGVEAGDEVIIPPYTFIATATACLIFGAIPVFVDVEADTLLIDPEKVEKAITAKTKAIIAVHMAGAPANLTRLKEIAHKHGLKLIEDAAQAVGSQWEGTGVGAIGDIGTFSFQSSKNVTAGEGGIVLTNDEELGNRAWSIANVGRIREGRWYQHESIGWNLRMTEFQAAILLAQMERLEEQIERREKNAKDLTERLKQIDGVRVMRRDPRITRHAQHIFMFRIAPELADQVDKHDVIRKINAEGIPVTAGYVSLNQNDAVNAEIYKLTGERGVTSCPISERACDKEVLWLVQNTLLGDEEDVEDIAIAVEKVFKTLG